MIGYIGSASELQEDLKGPAEYAAQNWEPGDVIALPDHAITSAIDYYLTNAGRPILHWPQLGVRQRYVEGFDLLRHPSGHDPRRVWLVSDGSVPGVTRFVKLLESEGYVIRGFRQFNGASILLYYSTQPTTSIILPSDGATLSGTKALLGARESDYDVKVKRVQFVLSGVGYPRTVLGSASETLAGWAFLWNSTTIPNGTYSLRSLATNAAGKSSYSRGVTVKVGNRLEPGPPLKGKRPAVVSTRPGDRFSNLRCAPNGRETRTVRAAVLSQAAIPTS